MEYFGELLNKYKHKKYTVFKNNDFYQLNGEKYHIFSSKREFDIFVRDEKLELKELFADD